VKRESRQAYRSSNPAKRAVVNALAVEGVEKEVYVNGMDHPTVAVVFTIPEAAKALGKTPLTLKRWISDDLIPPPVLIDTTCGYKHYSRGELMIILELLTQYSKDYTYIVANDNPFVHSVWQKLEHYRRTQI